MIRMSNHARQRCAERASPLVRVGGAIKLPKSATRRLRSHRGQRLSRGARLYATGSALLIVQGNVAVTALALSVEDLAEVIVYLTLGTWT